MRGGVAYEVDVRRSIGAVDVVQLTGAVFEVGEDAERAQSGPTICAAENFACAMGLRGGGSASVPKLRGQVPQIEWLEGSSRMPVGPSGGWAGEGAAIVNVGCDLLQRCKAELAAPG